MRFGLRLLITVGTLVVATTAWGVTDSPGRCAAIKAKGTGIGLAAGLACQASGTRSSRGPSSGCLAGASPRMEVQLLRYHHPDPAPDPGAGNLSRLGFNHVCLAVDDLEGEIARLRASGVRMRNEMMVFHGRKLIFLDGPEGVTVELAEWERSRA